MKPLAAFIIAILFVAATGTSVYARFTYPPVVQTAAVELAKPPVTQSAPPAVHVLAFGDLMLDRHVRDIILNKGAEYLFSNIQTLFAGQDIIVANAEGVFTDHASVVTPDSLVFTFSTTTLPLLRQLGFTLFSQANNHALNFGWAGLSESKTNIAEAGMSSFGDPDNIEPGPYMTTIRGTTVAFVGYNEFSAQHGRDTSTLAAIAEAKAAGAFTIVYPHWGVEYQSLPSEFQRTEAHAFIDAGADAVLGGHPHVVEPIEIYNGKAIFYSLGNFIFDQPWSDTREGLAVQLTLTPDAVAYTLHPYEIQLIQPTLMQGALYAVYLLGLSKSTIGADDSVLQAIANGGFVLKR